MAGGMFAGTDEAAGEVIERDGHKPTPNPNPNPYPNPYPSPTLTLTPTLTIPLVLTLTLTLTRWWSATATSSSSSTACPRPPRCGSMRVASPTIAPPRARRSRWVQHSQRVMN